MEVRKRPLNEWLGLLARLILGGVWIAAGGLKLDNLGESILAVRAFHLLPFELTTWVGYGLPILEVILGFTLIIGLFTRAGGWLSALLMAAFCVAIASVWARGISIDCGCFGGGGEVENAFASYPWELVRDVALGSLGVWLGLMPKTAFSLDARLADKSVTLADESVEVDEDNDI